MKYFILSCVLLSSSALAYASCFWTKVAEIRGDRGVVCTWKCGYGSDAIHKTTSGYSYCPRP